MVPTPERKTMRSPGFSAEDLLQALEDAQAGLRDLEDAIAGMKNPPEDLVEAADRIHRALADL
jgi:hypothetical protein